MVRGAAKMTSVEMDQHGNQFLRESESSAAELKHSQTLFQTEEEAEMALNSHMKHRVSEVSSGPVTVVGFC